MPSIYEKAKGFLSDSESEGLAHRFARKFLVELNPLLPRRIRGPWSTRLRNEVQVRSRDAFDARVRAKAAAVDARGGVHTFDHEGRAVRLALPQARTDFVQRRMLMEDQFFELDFLAATRRYLPEGSVVVDVGANIGNHALYWALLPHVRRVLAFEPVPPTFALLERNIELNRLGGSVTASNLAIGAETGEVQLFVPLDNPCLSRLEDDFSVNLEEKPKVSVFKVSLAPLDEACRELGRVDMVKIDVEGFEEAVLTGARSLLERHRPVIFIEVWPALRPGVERAIAPFGYRVTEQLDANNLIYEAK